MSVPSYSIPVSNLAHTLVCGPSEDLPRVLPQLVQPQTVVPDDDPLLYTGRVAHGVSGVIIFMDVVKMVKNVG